MGFVRTLTGKKAARAAVDAANIQAAGIDKAVEQLREATGQSMQMFDPYYQAGLQVLPQAQQLLGSAIDYGQLPSVMPGDIQQDSLFNFLKQQAIQGIESSAAARGRVGAGGTLAGIGETVQNLALQRTGDIQRQNLLARQQMVGEALSQRQLQSQELLNRLGLGQQAALAQAGQQQALGQTLADMTTGRAATQAAGVVGAANARTQGAMNLFSTAAQLGAMALAPALAPGAGAAGAAGAGAAGAAGAGAAGAGGIGSLSPFMAGQVAANPMAFPNVIGSGLGVGYMGGGR